MRQTKGLISQSEMPLRKRVLLGDTEIDTSGLLRCCIASIHEYVMPRAESAAPSMLVISCAHESEKDTGNIILDDGVWRWNHE